MFQNQRPLFSALSVLLLAGGALAQATPPALGLDQLEGRVHTKLDTPTPPTGIYCSCPPSNANSDSVMASVAQLPFVDGILVRVVWRDLEPSPGMYDFTLLQRQFELARQYDVDITLAVLGGSFGSPEWLATLGVPSIAFTFQGKNSSVPAAWDPTFLARWTDFVRVVGAAYDGHPRLKLVHITNASFNGMEMQLPLMSEAEFTAAGYTPTAYAESYYQVIDAFAEAFPSHALDVEVHPVFGNDAVAGDVVAYGHQTLGPRFGVFGAWWSTDNATQAYPGMYDLMLQAADLSFATVQVVGSWINTPERFDHDLAEYLATYTVGLTDGIDYYEIWNADLLAASLAPVWQRLEAEFE